MTPAPILCLDVVQDFKPGDPPPDGYVAWHEWAEVQHRAGLRQSWCGACGKWLFPQEACGHPSADRLTAARQFAATARGARKAVALQRFRAAARDLLRAR